MRKTNLLYDSNIGQENCFLTFSNYTEAMTGNHLSTNTKMFPSTFICVNIPSLSQSNIQEFIHYYLVDRYENKLAFLRDYYVKDDTKLKAEDNIYPLDYLLNILGDFDKDISINYIGQVSEQDYNGTFCDTMCIIGSEDNAGVVTYENNNSSKETIDYTAYTGYLYGWYTYDESKIINSYEYVGPSNYNTPLDPKNPESYDKPVLDNTENQYITSNTYSSLTFEQNSNPSDIEFNCIIPLFDIVNTSYKTNTNTFDTSSDIVIDLTESSCNIPMGIWFSQNFEPIKLQRNSKTKFWPSWSLVLSSQFKAFPKSSYLDTDTNNITSTDAFGTFAQVLAEQSKLTDNYSSLLVSIQSLSNRLTRLETKINNISTVVTVDDLINKIDNIGTTVKELQETVSQMNDLKNAITWNGDN